MSAEHSFTKEDVDFYFKELAKEYKKSGGKAMPKRNRSRNRRKISRFNFGRQYQ